MNFNLDHIPRYKEVSVFLLLVVTILLRYPFFPHEMRGDTFLVHAMVNTIVNEGSIPWMVHPLAATGFYPETYQTGSAVFLAMVSQLCNIDTEHAILFACFAFSILGTLAAYFMANRLTNNFTISLVTAFLFSISPTFVQFTLWTYSTRGLFLAMLPLILGTVIWLLVKLNECEQKTDLLKILGVFLFLMVIITTVHKMFVILLLIIPVSLLIVVFESYLLKKISSYRILKDNTYLFIGFILCLAFLLFHLSFSNVSIFAQIWYDYQTSSLFSGESYPILIINFMLNYSRKLSLIFFLGIIGFCFFIYYYKNTPSFVFLVSSTLMLLPLLPLAMYTPFLVIPFFSLFATIFLIKMVEYSESKFYLSNLYRSSLKNEKMNRLINRILCIFDNSIKNKAKILITVFFVLLITLSVLNTLYIMRYSSGGESVFMTAESYSTGEILRQSGAKMFTGGPSYEIYAVSGVPYNLYYGNYFNYLYANMFGIYDFAAIEPKFNFFNTKAGASSSLISLQNSPKIIPIQNTEQERIITSAGDNYLDNIWYDNSVYKISRINESS